MSAPVKKRTGVVLCCADCGVERYIPRCRAQRREGDFRCLPCLLLHRFGADNPNYRGGLPDTVCPVCSKAFKRYMAKGQKPPVHCSLACMGSAKRKVRDVRAERHNAMQDVYAGVIAEGLIPPQAWVEKVRPVPGFERYFITADGLVINTDGRRLRKTTDSSGYWRVSLVRNGVQRRYHVHILVACAWIGPRPSPKHIVAHSDGVRLNCHKDNLRWATPSENWQDMVKHGTAPIGERHYRAILDERSVKALRLERKTGAAVSELSAKYRVSYATIRRVVAGQSWRHVQ